MSTGKLAFTPIIFVLVALLFFPGNVNASGTTFAVAPFAYEVPNIGSGMADILRTEIAVGHLQCIGGKRMESACAAAGIELADLMHLAPEEQAVVLADSADYLLAGEIVAFKLCDKDQPVDLSDELNDLGRLIGQGSESAHVALDVMLVSTTDGSVVANWLIEGIESRNGIRMKSLSYGWAGSVDVQSDEFRETMIGRASYKALGKVLYELYELFPVEGKVLAVSGDAVVVGLDDTNGIVIGDELTVVHRNLITNSEGVVAWRDDRPVGRIEVVEFQPGRSLCIVLEGTGDISEGDIAIPLVSRFVLPQYADVAE